MYMYIGFWPIVGTRTQPTTAYMPSDWAEQARGIQGVQDAPKRAVGVMFCWDVLFCQVFFCTSGVRVGVAFSSKYPS